MVESRRTALEAARVRRGRTPTSLSSGDKPERKITDPVQIIAAKVVGEVLPEDKVLSGLLAKKDIAGLNFQPDWLSNFADTLKRNYIFEVQREVLSNIVGPEGLKLPNAQKLSDFLVNVINIDVHNLNTGSFWGANISFPDVIKMGNFAFKSGVERYEAFRTAARLAWSMFPRLKGDLALDAQMEAVHGAQYIVLEDLIVQKPIAVAVPGS